MFICDLFVSIIARVLPFSLSAARSERSLDVQYSALDLACILGKIETCIDKDVSIPSPKHGGEKINRRKNHES